MNLIRAFLVALPFVTLPARADDPHRVPPPPATPVVIVEHDSNNAAALAALAGSGVTLWVMCHREHYHPGARVHKVCPKKGG